MNINLFFHTSLFFHIYLKCFDELKLDSNINESIKIRGSEFFFSRGAVKHFGFYSAHTKTFPKFARNRLCQKLIYLLLRSFFYDE